MHPKSAPRRRHSDELKAKVVAGCEEPGASISGVAIAQRLNANLARKWRSGRGAKLAGMAIMPAAASKPSPLCSTAQFVAIEMPAHPKAAARATTEPKVAASIAEALIQIELRRGPLRLNVRWPTVAADDCRAWLSELSSVLLK